MGRVKKFLFYIFESLVNILIIHIFFDVSYKGPSINYVTRILRCFDPTPVLVTGGHISETPPPDLMWRHIFCNFTPRNYWIKTAVPKLFYFHLNYFSIKSTSNQTWDQNEQNINKIKNYDIILMKDKNLNILIRVISP